MTRSSILIALCGTGLFAQSYVGFIVKPANENSAEDTFPTGINERGEITGYYMVDATSYPHGFVRSEGGVITTFSAPQSGMFSTIPYGINAAGSITGYYQGPPPSFPARPVPHGFVRDPEGNFTAPFDPPGSVLTIPQSINAAGSVTGYYQEPNTTVLHGFVREDDGEIVSFDPPGSYQTLTASINAEGAVTGYFQESGKNPHGFLRRANGEIVVFDPPGSTFTIAVGINNAETITGYYTEGSVRGRGFVRDRQGKITPFDVGSDNTSPTFVTSINNDGEITGYSQDAQGVHGFVRAPDGTITSFDVPAPFCLSGQTHPSSINDAGVITGWCGVSLGIIGWVRYP
jgi:hypothetical protein